MFCFVRCVSIVMRKILHGHRLPMGSSSASIAQQFIVVSVYMSASSGILNKFLFNYVIGI